MSKKTRMITWLKHEAMRERDVTRIRQGKEVKIHLGAVVNRVTAKSYTSSIKQFGAWCASNGIYQADLELMDADAIKQLIGQYQYDALEGNGYTAATIHTKLAPVCRALNIDMGLIAKPKRLAKKIVRGVKAEANIKGKRELDNPKYAKLVAFQQAVGIRRSELAKLTGKDLLLKGKAMYVRVTRGKGGKEQWQYIMPQDHETVLDCFKGVAPDALVFKPGDIPPHADLHSLRAQHAQREYEWMANYLARRPDKRASVERVIIEYAKAHGSPKNVDAVSRELAKPVEYKLRGDTLKLAQAYGKPAVLDRTAIMFVSVLGLAHWRAGVTVQNYLIKPGQ